MTARLPTTTLALPQDVLERLRTVCDMAGVSQARLLESLLYQPDREIKRIVAEAASKIEARKESTAAKKKELSKALNGLSPEQLEELLNKVKQTG